LYETLKAVPEAAGYACGCWTSYLTQEWIYNQFGVLYNRYYAAELPVEFLWKKAKTKATHNHHFLEKGTTM
jgi:hypothetical protein